MLETALTILLAALVAPAAQSQERRITSQLPKSRPYPIADRELYKLIYKKRVITRSYDGTLLRSEIIGEGDRYIRGGDYTPVTGRFTIQNSSICVHEAGRGLTCNRLLRDNNGHIYYEFAGQPGRVWPVIISNWGE